MLRPATPLSVVLFLAFALLTISVVSTPIIKAIPLGTFNGFTFGVFGFCRPDGSCSSIEIGYDTGESSFFLALICFPVSHSLCLSNGRVC